MRSREQRKSQRDSAAPPPHCTHKSARVHAIARSLSHCSCPARSFWVHAQSHWFSLSAPVAQACAPQVRALLLFPPSVIASGRSEQFENSPGRRVLDNDCGGRPLQLSHAGVNSNVSPDICLPQTGDWRFRSSCVRVPSNSSQNISTSFRALRGGGAVTHCHCITAGRVKIPQLRTSVLAATSSVPCSRRRAANFGVNLWGAPQNAHSSPTRRREGQRLVPSLCVRGAEIERAE